MKELQRIRVNNYIQMILWIIMGLAMFILHEDTADLYTTILGIILLIQGLPQLILFIRERTRYLYSLIMLFSGFFTSIFGVVCIRTDILDYLPMIIGCIVLIHGGKEALMLFYIKRQMYQNWKLLVILACITVACAITLIVLTLFSDGVDLRPTGIAMIFDAVIECAILYIGEQREEEVVSFDDF